MDEKQFKLMKGSGALNIATGIVVLTTGIVVGILLIVNGARLLSSKCKNLF